MKLTVNNINPDDIQYEYSARGYMLYYKGLPIGGVCISKEAKGRRSNIRMNRDQAEMDKQRILSGHGWGYLFEIERIDKRCVYLDTAEELTKEEIEKELL